MASPLDGTDFALKYDDPDLVHPHDKFYVAEDGLSSLPTEDKKSSPIPPECPVSIGEEEAEVQYKTLKWW